VSTDKEAKIRRWEQYIEESRKEARLLSPEGQQELQTVIQSYEKLIARARDQATKPRG
jgi:F0F1-type ATP synthase membrane subunit b/b'